MYDTNKAIELIKNVIDNTRQTEVIHDSDNIIDELASMHTSMLNRDFCWGCKGKLYCDLMGTNFCKAYNDIFECIDDIINRYGKDNNDK